MSTFYFISSAVLILLSIGTFVAGNYEAARFTIICSFLCQILMKLYDKDKGCDK